MEMFTIKQQGDSNGIKKTNCAKSNRFMGEEKSPLDVSEDGRKRRRSQKQREAKRGQH